MSNAGQKASYWGQIIGWLVALGVPMTPLQGTYIGYGILLIAAVLTLWRAFAWVRDLNIQISHTAQGPISPTLVKTMFLMPVCFLFVLAGLLSYYAEFLVLFSSLRLRATPQVMQFPLFARRRIYLYQVSIQIHYSLYIFILGGGTSLLRFYMALFQTQHIGLTAKL
jgi:hypothetical protein